MMKKLIEALAFTLVIASLAPSVRAEGSLPDAKIPHLLRSGAHPNSAMVSDATHYFEIHVQGRSISELAIDLPEGISIEKSIEVVNESGQKLDAQVSIAPRKATVVFSQPVEPDTTLSIEMQGINTPGYDSTWQYRIYSKLVGLNREISLGSVQISTYR